MNALTLRLVALVAALALSCSCASRPPAPVTDPRHPAVAELVNLRNLNAGLRFDVRYATRDNFTRQQLYPMPAAWLRRDASEALLRVQRDLRAQGLGLKVFDAYRPLGVQQQMWNLIRDERYVSNPAKNAGRHTRGTAIDVTLVDARGRELPMPTGYDDFSEKAHRGAQGIPPAAQRNALLLERTMTRHGFVPYPFEWWHFDFAGWERHPPLDVPLTSLPSR
jgi:D-alanyl-D-alanine dipeptidase